MANRIARFTMLFIYIQLGGLYAFAQTTLFTEDFESDGEGSTYRSNSFTDNANDFFYRTNEAIPTGATNNAAYSGWNNTYYWIGEDINSSDNPLGSGEDGYIVFETVDVSSYQNGTVTIKGYFGGNSNGATSTPYENNDFLRIQYAFDADIASGANSAGSVPSSGNLTSGSYSTAGQFAANLASNSNLYDDTDLDGTGDGTQLFNAMAEFSFSVTVPASASNMSVRFLAEFDQGSDEIAFDYVRIEATGPLPIELLAFNALSQEDKILLLWETASEENFDKFIVEKSTDGQSWNSIGEVKGQGDIQQGHRYQMFDENPQAGKNAFRLKMVDYDGTEDYSRLLSLNFEPKIHIFAYLKEEYLLRVKISQIQGRGKLSLLNSLGQEVKNLVVLKEEFDWTLPPLPKGYYYLRYLDGTTTFIQKIRL